MLHRHKNFWKFITWEPQMLGRWNLPQLCIFMRPSIWQKIWPWPIGRGRVWPKSLWKNSPKIVFLAPFFGIFRTVSETITYVILCLALHHWWNGLYKSDLIWGCNLWKTTQKQPKILIFENLWKLVIQSTREIIYYRNYLQMNHETFQVILMTFISSFLPCLKRDTS